MASHVEHLDPHAPTVAQTLADVCDAFEREWYHDAAPRIEEWLELVDASLQAVLFRRLLAIELAHRALLGQPAESPDFERRFPTHRREIADVFGEWQSRVDDSRECSYSSTDLWGRIAQAVDPAHMYSPGDEIGRYQLLERVGRGGFGEVWKAFDPELKRPVAIKFARSDRTRSAELIEQLRTEARRAAGLKHAGIVPVYDIVGDADGVYIVSEFVVGETLSSRMKRERIPVDEALDIVVQVARALQYAHAQGIVHRDVKPGNILLRDGGGAVITDFGLAATEDELVRERGGTFGTVRYMSPEQVRGESNTCDGRTDLYSLGVVFYELLVHRAPYPGENSSEYKQQVLTRPARPLRAIDDQIDPDLERICLKCLGKQVADRFSTCDELAKALAHWQKSGAPPWWQRKWLVAAAVLLTVGIAGAAVVSVQNDRPTGASLPGSQAQGAAFRMVAWSPYDSNSTQGYRPDEGRFVFQTQSPALFENGVNQSGVIDAETVFSLTDGKGSGGLFWGLRSDATGEHCWAVFVGRPSPNRDHEMWIDELTISEGPGGRRSVTTFHRMHEKFLKRPIAERARLRVSADMHRVQQIWLDGEPMLDDEFQLLERDWAKVPGSGWGVAGAFGEISVHSVTQPE